MPDAKVPHIEFWHVDIDLDLIDIDQVRHRVPPVHEFAHIHVEAVDQAVNGRMEEPSFVHDLGPAEAGQGEGTLVGAAVELLLCNDLSFEEEFSALIELISQVEGGFRLIKCGLEG